MHHLTPNCIAKINRAHRHHWTANEIARVYGYRRSEVQRVIAGEHRQSQAEHKAAWRARRQRAAMLAAGCDARVIAANFGRTT